MKHPHAELMLLYAQDWSETDEPWMLWQSRDNDNMEWQSILEHPRWFKDCQYRRKPRTININGFEVPEPVRKPLKERREYWVIDFELKEHVGFYIWNENELDMELVRIGIVHLDKEAAILHAKALLSFTEQKK